MDLRCPSGILYARATDGSAGGVEVKCRSNRCGHQRGTVVLHLFHLGTGECTTQRFKDPVP